MSYLNVKRQLSGQWDVVDNGGEVIAGPFDTKSEAIDWVKEVSGDKAEPNILRAKHDVDVKEAINMDISSMREKPTPDQIAAFISEHQYGMPDFGSPSGEMPGVLPPEMISQAQSAEPQMGYCTEMRSCAAVRCIHNKEGGFCSLDAIDVNEYGGCSQHEATASDDEDDGRYEEEQTDVTGGVIGQQPQSPEEPRHWETGKYDPKGSSV